MKPIVEKMLSSGLIDKATTRIMEQWGLLPDGSVDKTREDALKHATQAELMRLAEDLATEVEKAHVMKETSFDLDRLKWPVQVGISSVGSAPKAASGVIDRLGRYYFRVQDVELEWFVPGYTLTRTDQMLDYAHHEMITEAQFLYIGDEAVCVQVSTKKG